MVFETAGGQGHFAFWQNPIFYARAKRTRSVVLVSVDTLRPDHLGCYGYRRETSPAIDALAEDGALFLNTYASSPWTLPSHVSLLTSLNSVHHQVYYENDKMAHDQITLADLMRAGGFMTAAFTDGGFLSRVYGFSKGFDSYREREDGVLGQDSAMRIWRMASRWLDGNRQKDFFLFLHTYQPHDPYACPGPYATMFLEDDPVWRSLNLMGRLGGYSGIYRELTEKERRNIIGLYDGEIRYTDEALVGPLVGKLKELGLYDSSLIILTSDHGEEFFDHHSWTHGHHLYDEALKVPLIMKFPEGRFKGQRLGSIVRLIDIMPTLLEEFGIPPSGPALDGKSLLPVLRGRERGDRTFLADVGDNILKSHVGRKIAMNRGKDKMILNKPCRPEDLLFFASPPRPVPPVELFNLGEDPQEKRNLADEKSAVARALNDRVVAVYKNAGRRKPVKVELDEQLKERLRALGYIR
ncbi:MAG: sulfatase [Candidatus Aminicenantes bacterium]|nr:sulfatase [Candidatus Aminicenantes bacterium]